MLNMNTLGQRCRINLRNYDQKNLTDKRTVGWMEGWMDRTENNISNFFCKSVDVAILK